MADITPIVSLNGELAMPEKVWMQGPKGDTGAAATVTVGTVTTGETGTDAIVTNIGTESAAVLDFIIPRGETGAVGAVGPQGPKGDKGDPGPAGAGVPDGGTVGQLLGKTETGTAWIDPPHSGGGGGGGAEQETITWDGETSGLVSADVNGHLYYKVSDYVPKIKDLIGGTVSCSDGGKKVIAADEVEYEVASDDGFSVGTSNIDLTFFVVYKDNAVINSFDFPQKGVYFEKGTAFVSALSFTVTNDSNVTVEINLTVDWETGATTPTVVTPMCLIKEAAGRGFCVNATMRMPDMTLSSFSAYASDEFNAMFALYPGAGLNIDVYAVKYSYKGACSVSNYTLAMTAIG